MILASCFSKGVSKKEHEDVKASERLGLFKHQILKCDDNGNQNGMFFESKRKSEFLLDK